MRENDKPIDCPEYDDVRGAMDAARAKIREHGRSAVAALFKRFFAEYPKITAVGWCQYTPYFNDGEPCEFGVCEFLATTKDGIDFSEVSSLYDDEHGFVEGYRAEGGAAAALSRLSRSKDDAIFEAAFGDHAMIIATPNGFHVSEYDHD